MPTELFRFRYRHPLTGKWVRARYAATRDEIASRYAEWEILGPPEIRVPSGGHFHPFRVMQHAELMRLEDQAPDMRPVVDACERFLLALFLRRYVTWCVRKRHFDRAGGSAALYRRLTS